VNTPDATPPTTDRGEVYLLLAIVGLGAAVALFGLAFPELLAPAIAIALLAVIVAFDWLLPSGELARRRVSARVDG
jgi:hypothetical protein